MHWDGIIRHDADLLPPVAASWKQAEAARDESGGLSRMVSDAEILEAYKTVAETEGIFCEPASAASIAGVIKLGMDGFFGRGACRGNT